VKGGVQVDSRHISIRRHSTCPFINCTLYIHRHILDKMSFNDLERGQSSQPLLRGGAAGEHPPLKCTWTNTDLVPPPSLSSSIFPHRLISILLQSTDEDKTFTTAKDAVSIQVFKIQSNVQGIQRLVDKLGAQGDGPALRTSLYVNPTPILHISIHFNHHQSPCS